MEPLGTVIFRPSSTIFGFLPPPYILWARLTQTACWRRVASVEGCEMKRRRRAARSRSLFAVVAAAAGAVGGTPSASASIFYAMLLSLAANVDIETNLCEYWREVENWNKNKYKNQIGKRYAQQRCASTRKVNRYVLYICMYVHSQSYGLTWPTQQLA